MSFKQVFTFKMYPFLSDFFFSWDNRDECPHLFQIIPRSSLRAVTVHRNHQCKVQPKELLAFGNHCAMSHVGFLDGQHFVWTAGVGWQMNHSSQDERPTISNLLGSSLTCHEPPSLWRMQSCSLYHQTQLSTACGEDSMICDCNGLPAGKDNCLTPHWHCSFYLCHLVLFSFLISGGLHVSETLFFFFQELFPADIFSCRFSACFLSSLLHVGVSLVSLPGTHFLQLEASTWPKTSRLKVPTWEQTPRMLEKAKLTAKLRDYLSGFCGSTLPSSYKLFKILLP